jgi:membrane protein
MPKHIKSHVIPFGQAFLDKWKADNVAVLGTSIAYYALFSLFPLLLVVLSVVGLVLGNENSVVRQSLQVVAGESPPAQVSADEQVFAFIRQTISEEAAAQIETTLDRLNERGVGASLIGFVALLFTASRVFAGLDKAFQVIWETASEESGAAGFVGTALTVVQKKLLAFGLVLGCALLLMVALLAGVVLSVLRSSAPTLPGSDMIWQVVYLLVALALLTLVFMLLFKYLPDTHVAWGDVWFGALLTAVLFTLLVNLSSLVISRSDYQAYGAIGSSMTLMLWVFLSSQVLFLGAEFTQVYAHMYGSRQRGQPAPDPHEATTLATVAQSRLAAAVLGHQPGATARPPGRFTHPRPRFAPLAQTGQGIVVAAGVGALMGALAALTVSIGVVVGGVRRLLRMFRVPE